ncbi:MAG: 16S rRNA (cytosine(1402)-N(4))-methyltransferase RsmH [Planctomycetaceae bacterium]|nr:16S rRNA (cytosine(1402)-N(4))-methyltransferase RsmH [Planctomycetaceae bacterium]
MSSSASRSVHVPVMPREVLRELRLQPGMIVLDGTVGAAGHTSLILRKIGPNGHVIGLDRDPMMLDFARNAVQGQPCSLFHDSYIHAPEVLQTLGIPAVDRVLLDLGLSSDQLADRQRGFGFDAGGPLDMRFDSAHGTAAADLLQQLSPQELEYLLTTYGEEPRASAIAAELIRRRSQGAAVITAEQLEACICGVYGLPSGNRGKNPATRTFQALRIAVNEELQHVETMLNQILPEILKPGGIAVVISFHSIEDRIVKNAFKGQHGWQVLTKSPLEATPAEIRINPRSRSARIRVAERISGDLNGAG